LTAINRKNGSKNGSEIDFENDSEIGNKAALMTIDGENGSENDVYSYSLTAINGENGNKTAAKSIVYSYSLTAINISIGSQIGNQIGCVQLQFDAN
jgi:hypothetical protein